MLVDSQSVSFSGSITTLEDFLRSTFCTERERSTAWRITRSAILRPQSTWLFSHSSNGSRTMLETSFIASRLESFSLVWPWNCGSSTLAERKNTVRDHTSSAISLMPRGIMLWCSANAFTASNTPSRNPASCVPPAGVGIRFAYDSP